MNKWASQLLLELCHGMHGVKHGRVMGTHARMDTHLLFGFCNTVSATHRFLGQDVTCVHGMQVKINKVAPGIDIDRLTRKVRALS